MVLGLCLSFVLYVPLVLAAGPSQDTTPRTEDETPESADTGDERARSDAGTNEVEQPAAAAEPLTVPFRFGGALRSNYIFGNYDNRRGRGVGDFDFEIFNFNADLDHDNFIGRMEYRWYNEYSVMREAWLGYVADRRGTVRAGLIRSPFGPGPLGISTSWFFDQHGHVGLADDPDLGVRWTGASGNVTLDLAYYLRDGGHLEGNSLDAARFTFDVVKRRSADGGAEGFDEEHKFNVRAIYSLDVRAIGSDSSARHQHRTTELSTTTGIKTGVLHEANPEARSAGLVADGCDVQ